MKAVMISIQPKWVEKICCGKKTIEVRKTRPKIDTPFKCYIYCTQGGDWLVSINGKVNKTNSAIIDLTTNTIINELNGKVIGEFVCDRIEELHEYELTPSKNHYEFEKERLDLFLEQSCLSYGKISEYRKNLPYFKPLYGWHITDLVIYDEPKELSEFWNWKKCNSCKVSGYESTACCFDIDCKVPALITRPPQSWCYVEAEE